jgi:3-dehydroquinate synthase
MSLLRQEVEVRHRGGIYPVTVQAGLLDTIGGSLAPYLSTGQAIVVTDEEVWGALGGRLLAAFSRSNILPHPIILPPGEESKSWDKLIGLVERLLSLNVERSDTILAFGGGVVGDLAGFASAILKRGCHYIQVPTSLLAQVDSSVGGKTGINAKAGKNLVGAFHQPKAVLIDPTALETLPERHIRAGYAEIVKYGLINRPDFFAWCEANGPALIAGDLGLRTYAILESVRAKAKIVGRDERELSGERALLNFGHSFAHALETETGFGDALLHGEAVALGMTLAYRFSVLRGLCRASEADRVAGHLKSCGLPTEISQIGMSANGAKLAGHIRHDKKNVKGSPTLVLTRGIGAAFLEHGVPYEEIASFLDFELARERPRNAALC